MAAKIPKIQWSDLDAHKQQALRLIYAADRWQEIEAQKEMAIFMKYIPAEKWRWISWYEEYGRISRLKQWFREANLIMQRPAVDTLFEALRDDGLLLVRYPLASMPLIEVRMTRQGRALVTKQLEQEANEQEKEDH